MKGNRFLIKKKQRNRPHSPLLIAGVVLIACNLRPAITTVGPLVGAIRQDLGISNGTAGLLTTIPLLAFAILSFMAPRIARFLGNERALFSGLILILIGIAVRPIGWIPMLFFGTILIGAGVALGNVLLPGLIKKRFADRPGLMTSLYTTVMAGFAAVGSGLSVPLAQGLGFGWRMTLLIWGVLTIAAIGVWLPQLRHKMTKPQADIGSMGATRSLWLSPLAWQVTGFMGLQSFLFYCSITWFPEILKDGGLSLNAAGWVVSLMQILGLPATFLAPVLAERMRHQVSLVIGIGVIYGVGILCLILPAPIGIAVFGTMMVGIAQGASISLALTFLNIRTKNAESASALSGMAQSIGYLLAAMGPFLIGALYDALHTWTTALILLLIVAVIMTVCGLFAGRDRVVE